MIQIVDGKRYHVHLWRLVSTYVARAYEARLTSKGYIGEAASYGFLPVVLISSNLDSLDVGQVNKAIQRFYAEDDVFSQSFESVLVVQEHASPGHSVGIRNSGLSSGFEHVFVSDRSYGTASPLWSILHRPRSAPSGLEII